MTDSSASDLDKTCIHRSTSSATTEDYSDEDVTRIYASEVLPSAEFASEDVTRIAIIHPQTGVEVVTPDNTSDGIDMDCTVVSLPSAISPAPSTEANAVYVPDYCHKEPGEATELWRPGVVRVKRFREWFQRFRRHIIGFAIIACVATLISTFSLRASVQETASVAHVNTAYNSAPHTRPATTEPMTRCSLDEAVNWLINGEYEKARAGYRFLARQHPGSKAYATTLSILETREEYQ